MPDQLAAGKNEQAGDLEEASKSYREALLVGGPDATTCFYLANVLYNLGRLGEAVERYRQVVELNPSQAEAWNNLGIVLADLGRRAEAIDTLKTALECNPVYADASYNLGDILAESCRGHVACKHWQAYLAQDRDSRWARYAREQIRRVDSGS